MLSLEEAIKHCEELAIDNESMCEYNLGCSDSQYQEWRKCAKDHRQLAEWLRELKGYKKAYTEIDSKIECDYMGNNEYEMAVSDGYQGAINIIDRCIEEVNADDE